MTIGDCLAVLESLELSRFDLLLISVGRNEALAFVEPSRWASQLESLFGYIHANSPSATKTVMLSIPFFGRRSHFPRLLGLAVDRHARRLNQITAEQIRARANVSLLVFQIGDDLESDGSHTYQRWAAGIAPKIATELQPQWGEAERSETVHEDARQDALNALGLLDMPPDRLLDEIVNTAKDMFGAPLAGVTFVDAERQSMASAVGMSAADIPRSEAFCDITIRRPQIFVIEDTLLDPRYSSNPVVTDLPKIRFYAGYPIEAPNGQRIGALCVMDTKPRHFANQDAALLRDLAQRAQNRLWDLSADEVDTL